MALLKKKQSAGSASMAALSAAFSNAKKKSRKKAEFILDLDETRLRAVRADSSATDVSEVELPGALSETTGQAAFNQVVAKAAAEAGLKRGASVAIDLPRSAAVLRQILVPLVSDPNEINSMVHFQVSRDLPFKPEDGIIDFQLQREVDAPAGEAPADSGLKEKPSEQGANTRKLEVLVAAVKNDLIQRYQGAAEAAGLKVTQFGLRSLSNLRALAETHKISDTETICLISLRWDEIVIEVGTAEVLAISRVVLTAPEIVRRLRPSEGTAANGAQEIIALINTEAVRTFHAYEGMAWHRPIKEVVVAGELGLETALIEKLKSRLSVPCSVLPAASAGNFAIRGLQLLSQEGASIDFIDPKKPRVVTDRKKIKMLAAIAAGIVILFALFAVRANQVNKRLKVKLEVQNQLNEAKNKQQIYRRMRQQVLAVRGWRKEGPAWLDHYAYLSSILPPATDLYVSSITSSSAGTLRLAVQARTGEILADMEKRFRAAGYSVKPISITPGSDKYGYNFRTTVELVIPAKLKFDLKKLEAPPRPEDDMPPSTSDASPARKSSVVAKRP